MFLFWSIACGIMCGTGVASYAMMLSLFLTVAVLLLSRMPLIRAPYLLMINARDSVDSSKIEEILSEGTSYHALKSTSLSDGNRDMAYEFRGGDCAAVLERLNGLEGVESVTILEHNGDVTF